MRSGITERSIENQSHKSTEPYGRLFLRFLRFGFLAWGGPVPQIAMIRQELVDEERWISPDRFNRVLAVYQVLPGPEAHELCVYFGMLARGRFGAFLAGLGFMLPGFVLMLTLSWLYVEYGLDSPYFAALLVGFQPAVMALILRAVHRIGIHALTDRWLWGIGVLAGVLQWTGVHFALTLMLSGVAYVLVRGGMNKSFGGLPIFLLAPFTLVSAQLLPSAPGVLDLFLSGLKAGLLTFGGAYTVIPFLQHDAVIAGAWMTDSQFLDGLALSGILPAPLVIFSTFVGYLGGGLSGALSLTAGIFLPAFGFTMVGHAFFERLVEKKRLHSFLDGVTAGIIGLIAVVAIDLFPSAVTDTPQFLIFATGLLIAFRWRSKFSAPLIVIGGGVIGMIISVWL